MKWITNKELKISKGEWENTDLLNKKCYVGFKVDTNNGVVITCLFKNKNTGWRLISKRRSETVLGDVISDIENKYKVQRWLIDSWDKAVFTKDLLSTKRDGKTSYIPQTINMISPSMKQISELFKREKISHNLTKEQLKEFKGVKVLTDANGNIRPSRTTSTGTIATPASLIIAMAGAMQ